MTNYQLKLHINKDVKPVAQQVRRLPFGLRDKVLLLLQYGEWRAVSYASRNLTEVERRCAQTEKEALALVWACERLNLYVYGCEFELETDHKPLECIFSRTPKSSGRFERWVLRLQCHKY